MRIGAFIFCLPILAGLAACMSGGHKGSCPLDTDECLEMLRDAYARTPWLGIELDESVKGRACVKLVAADSPAEKAGIKAGDVILTLNGVAFIEVFDRRREPVCRIGEETLIKIERKGLTLELTARLIAMPREVVAQFVGNHMLDGHL